MQVERSIQVAQRAELRVPGHSASMGKMKARKQHAWISLTTLVAVLTVPLSGLFCCCFSGHHDGHAQVEPIYAHEHEAKPLPPVAKAPDEHCPTLSRSPVYLLEQVVGGNFHQLASVLSRFTAEHVSLQSEVGRILQSSRRPPGLGTPVYLHTRALLI